MNITAEFYKRKNTSKILYCVEIECGYTKCL